MFLVYLVFPIVEIYFLFHASRAFGFLPILATVVFTAWLGSRLVKSQGMKVLAQFQTRMNEGHIPKREAIEGLLILMAGVLLIAPGFITDGVGILCLLPLSRGVIANLVTKWVETRIKQGKIKVYASSTFGGPDKDFKAHSFKSSNPFENPQVRDVTPNKESDPPELP